MNVLKEIEFALQHGHTDIKVGVENDGTPYVMGTFGYIATSDKAEYQAIMDLINKYTVVETESKVEKLHAASQITVGETYKVKSRVRTVVAVIDNYDLGNGLLQTVVEYTVKDGSSRLESMSEFDRWLSKA